METPPPEQRVTRSSERAALAEISLSENEERVAVNISENSTPSASPEELIIQTRGPRNIPITWSPVDYNKYMRSPNKHETPRKASPVRELRSSIRKRLMLSPGKNPARNLHPVLNSRKYSRVAQKNKPYIS